MVSILLLFILLGMVMFLPFILQTPAVCNVSVQSITPDITDTDTIPNVSDEGSCNEVSTVSLLLRSMDKVQKQIYNVIFAIGTTNVTVNINISE